MRKVNIAVIGAGSAGLTAYRSARKYSDSVLLIDPGPLGTTCARVGCMPSKLLISAADAAWNIQHASTFGITARQVHVDGVAVLERVRQMRDRFVAKVLKGMESIPELDKLDQSVRFVADHRLETSEGELIEVDRVIIATGSRPAVPDMLRLAGKRLLLNDDLFELSTLPKSVVVFGPGVIGLELGQALSRLGVRVRMLGVGGSVGPLGDTDIRQAALECFSREFPLDPDAQVNSIKESADGVEVTFVNNGQPKTETFDYLFAATGRRPNVDHLGLENTSLALDERGVPVFDPHTLQCSLAHIFIVGDANNHLPLLHEAVDEGAIAGRNAAQLSDVQRGRRTVPLAIVFSDPQMATIGLQPSQIEQAYAGNYAVASFDFANQARAKVLGRDYGLMKVWAEKESGILLGVEILGPDAEHLAHLLAWSIQQQLRVDDLLGMPFYHPVLEEGVRSLLKELKGFI
ncbi:dihydrolipoyl dehydrogenase [Neptunomonas phycophila]|uniref:Dihydrolipoyl dehydrogenase n=1 Tax=Neptunomonas phycophila TaxID=1572645 RepID=A0AAW7XDE4_9GAMM|nr:dihydrolipoyl dehydrogenase [Neptunomonas phycophila]MDO6452015.1 dihydrolipoyl dehydrogenase [Neptunomonas phycophila]